LFEQHPFSLHTLLQVHEAGQLLDRFHQKHGRYAPGPSQVPRVAVQFWPHEPPPQVRRLLEHNRMLCARHGIEYRVFDEATARLHMRERKAFDVLRAFELAPHPAVRSDLFRFWYLAEFGGCYVDADMVMAEPFPDLFRLGGELVLFQWDNGKLNTACHWLMACAAGSRWMRFATEVIWRSIASTMLDPTQHNAKGLLGVSGPGRFTRAIGTLMQEFGRPQLPRWPITLSTVSHAHTLVNNSVEQQRAVLTGPASASYPTQVPGALASPAREREREAEASVWPTSWWRRRPHE